MPNPSIPAPREQVIPASANLFKSILLIGLLFSSFYLADRAATWIEPHAGGSWQAAAGMGLLVGGLAVWDVVLLTGMGVLAHDAVHRVLFRSSVWNEFWGGLLSALVLIPFHANRQFHLTHHSYAHQPGLDPENAMHERPLFLAATLGSVIALLEQYRIFFNNLARIADRRYRGRVIRDSLYMSAAALVYFVLVPGFGWSLAYTVWPMLAVFPLVFAWRALSDHYAIPPIERSARTRAEVLDTDPESWHRDREKRQREVTGWVVLTHPWLEWLWSHVNYHEVHHKYPWLSHVYLKPLFEATRDHQPYLVVRGYWRSLFNLAGRRYYGTRADMRRFLTTPDW